jgi:ABC-2 type transport system ATP-binding protein
MIEVEKVTKDYKNIRALEEVSFRIGSGEVVGLLGPNGAGKTTLLKILTGFFEPTSGLVKVGGIDVEEDPLGVRRLVGYLPENAPLYPEMLVQDYLLMMADLRDLRDEERRRLLSRCIESTGISEVLTRPVGELSKGFRQRVGLAQAILHEPKILILDEPTSGLDPSQIVEVRNLIRGLASRSTVLVSTHILSEVEQSCERVLVLINGKLKADARLSELTASSRVRVSYATEEKPDSIRAGLLDLPGVSSVELEAAEAGQVALSVGGESEADLERLVYDRSRERGWPLRELRRDTRTLESVYRGISAGKEGSA